MKIAVIVSFFTICNNCSYCQVDSTLNIDTLFKKNWVYRENSNMATANPNFIKQYYDFIINSTIIVLNGTTIIKINSKEFLALRKEDILSYQVIDDPYTSASIKKIIILKTK